MKIRLYAYGHDGSIRDIKEVPSDARGGAKRQAVNGLPWRCEFPKPRIIERDAGPPRRGPRRTSESPLKEGMVMGTAFLIALAALFAKAVHDDAKLTPAQRDRQFRHWKRAAGGDHPGM